MFFIALVVNPILVWLMIRRNPYPYTLMTLRESGVAAFFTRSSAANIPVNLEICRRLNLPESTYSISIPVGATVNMQGAAITITVLTLAGCTSEYRYGDLPFVCSCALCVWRLRCSRWVADADPACLRSFRH